MIPAKNYEAVSKFVKVMPRILWTLFPDMVYILFIAQCQYKVVLKGEEYRVFESWRLCSAEEHYHT